MPSPSPEENTVVAFDTANMGANFERSQARQPLPEHVMKALDQIQAVLKNNQQIAAQAVPAPPSYFPDGLVIDWIDATVDVKVQIIRKTDKKVYDLKTNAFVDESTATNSGLIPLVREVSPLRAAYQVMNITTPPSIFTNGYYRIFYYGTDNTLLDVGSFGMNSGCPYIDGVVPINAVPTVQDFVNSVPPSNEIAVAVAAQVKPLIPTSADNAIKLLAADVRKHTTPNSPGAALNKILGST